MNSLGSKYRISFERIEELFSLDDGPASATTGVTQLPDVVSSSSSPSAADKKRKEEVC
jgi:hypothetical protein